MPLVTRRRCARSGHGEGYAGTGRDRLTGWLINDREGAAGWALPGAVSTIDGLNLRGAQRSVVEARLVHQALEPDQRGSGDACAQVEIDTGLRAEAAQPCQRHLRPVAV